MPAAATFICHKRVDERQTDHMQPDLTRGLGPRLGMHQFPAESTEEVRSAVHVSDTHPGYPTRALPRTHPVPVMVKPDPARADLTQSASFLSMEEDTKVKGARKRDRSSCAQGEGYRERWMKKQPRRNVKTWVSDICSACEHASGGMLTCMGPCLRAFHHWCVGISDEELQKIDTSKWFCPECDSGIMRCYVCGEFGAGYNDPFLRKCSLGSCGRFYHLKCVNSLKFTRSAAKGQHFYCPQHYCVSCGKSGDGVDMVKCIRCPNAYHCSCTSKDGAVKKLKQGTKVILCAAHQGSPAPPYVRPPPSNPERLQEAIEEARAQGIPVGKERRAKQSDVGVSSGMGYPAMMSQQFTARSHHADQLAHCTYPPKGYAAMYPSQVDPFAPRSGVLAAHHLDERHSRNVRPRLGGVSVPTSSLRMSNSASALAPWQEQVPTARPILRHRAEGTACSEMYVSNDLRSLCPSSVPGYHHNPSALGPAHGDHLRSTLRSVSSAPPDAFTSADSNSCSMYLDETASRLDTTPCHRPLHRLASHISRQSAEVPCASYSMDRYQPVESQTHHFSPRLCDDNTPNRRSTSLRSLPGGALDEHVSNSDFIRVVMQETGKAHLGSPSSLPKYLSYSPDYRDNRAPSTEFECTSSLKHEPKESSSVTIHVQADASCTLGDCSRQVSAAPPAMLRSLSSSSNRMMNCYNDVFMPMSNSNPSLVHPSGMKTHMPSGAPEGATGALPDHTTSLVVKSYPMLERSESSLNASHTKPYPVLERSESSLNASHTSTLLHHSREHLSAYGPSSIHDSPATQQASSGASHFTQECRMMSPTRSMPDPTDLLQSFMSPQALDVDLAGFEDFVDSIAAGAGGSDCRTPLPLHSGHMGIDHDMFASVGEGKAASYMQLGAELLDTYPA